jgi:hypothetical protein
VRSALATLDLRADATTIDAMLAGAAGQWRDRWAR